MRQEYEVVVVGGGPAGASASLWLARYRRRVLLLDAGRPRNAPTWAVHGYPGIPDLTPEELRRRFEEQLLAAGAERRQVNVTHVHGEKNAFGVVTAGGDEIACRRVLLSFGMRDHLPEVDHLRELYGSAVFHCPDCDGPSMAGCIIGVLGADQRAAGLALYLLTWAERVLLLTNGAQPDLPADVRATLSRNRVEIVTGRLVQPVLQAGALTAYRLEGDRELELSAIFFPSGSEHATTLAAQLECDVDEHGFIRVERSQETSTAGVYAAGDITGKPHLVIAAAADGVRAALALHRSLLPPEFEL